MWFKHIFYCATLRHPCATRAARAGAQSTIFVGKPHYLWFTHSHPVPGAAGDGMERWGGSVKAQFLWLKHINCV